MQHWELKLDNGNWSFSGCYVVLKKFTKIIFFFKYALKIMGSFLTEMEDKGICKIFILFH